MGIREKKKVQFASWLGKTEYHHPELTDPVSARNDNYDAISHISNRLSDRTESSNYSTLPRTNLQLFFAIPYCVIRTKENEIYCNLFVILEDSFLSFCILT